MDRHIESSHFEKLFSKPIEWHQRPIVTHDIVEKCRFDIEFRMSTCPISTKIIEQGNRIDLLSITKRYKSKARKTNLLTFLNMHIYSIMLRTAICVLSQLDAGVVRYRSLGHSNEQGFWSDWGIFFWRFNDEGALLRLSCEIEIVTDDNFATWNKGYLELGNS